MVILSSIQQNMVGQKKTMNSERRFSTNASLGPWRFISISAFPTVLPGIFFESQIKEMSGNMSEMALIKQIIERENQKLY